MIRTRVVADEMKVVNPNVPAVAHSPIPTSVGTGVTCPVTAGPPGERSVIATNSSNGGTGN